MDRINAACGYCGQFVNLEFETTLQKAEERARLVCSCPESIAHQKAYKEKVDAARRRETSLKKATELIDKKFGKLMQEEAEEAGEERKHPMPEVVVDTLKEVCILVYDRLIKTVTLDLPYGAKGKVTMNSKGALIIERKDTVASRDEI